MLDDIRWYIGMNSSITERAAGGRMGWGRHVEHMDGGRLPKMAMSHMEGGRSGRGRPRLRWKDCVEMVLGGLVGMAIGGSGLWIEGGGELWPMIQQSVSQEVVSSSPLI